MAGNHLARFGRDAQVMTSHSDSEVGVPSPPAGVAACNPQNPARSADDKEPCASTGYCDNVRAVALRCSLVLRAGERAQQCQALLISRLGAGPMVLAEGAAAAALEPLPLGLDPARCRKRARSQMRGKALIEHPKARIGADQLIGGEDGMPAIGGLLFGWRGHGGRRGGGEARRHRRQPRRDNPQRQATDLRHWQAKGRVRPATCSRTAAPRGRPEPP